MARPDAILEDSFDSPGDLAAWRVDLSPEGVASFRHVVEGDIRGVEIDVESRRNPIGLSRRIDASGLRGERVCLVARVRTQKASVRAALHVRHPAVESGIGDVAESREVTDATWVDLQECVDVADDASEIEVKLSARGEGEAWFDRLKVERLGRPDRAQVAARRLTSPQRDALVALANVLALVRYFHPSDEGATADWDRVAVSTVARILEGPDARSVESITELLEQVAPLAQIYRAGEQPRPKAFPATAGRTTWWHHAGLGPGYPNVNLRVGVDEPETSGLVYAAVPAAAIKGCRRATVSLRCESSMLR